MSGGNEEPHAADDVAQLGVVDMRHVREARAKLLDVSADKRIGEEQHYVVRYEHEIAGVKLRVHTA